jgi:YVTN family beta-propeller protein
MSISMKTHLFMISILCLLCAGCQTVQTILKPVLVEEGEIFVYIQPLPQEANGLRFSLEGVYAVRSDGVEVPLTLSLAEFKGSEAKRQRFVASGRLQPGVYRGLSFKAGKASLQGEEGEKALVVSEKREIAEFSFEVKRKQALVIDLLFKTRESLGSGTGFKPVFSMSIPPKPLNTLIGYVTNYAASIITVFDKRSGNVLEVIETGKGPRSVVFDRNRLLAYVVISGEDMIEVIDLQSHTMVNTIRLNTGDNPSEAALTPDGATLLVANEGSNTLSFIDPASNFETTRLNVGNRPVSLLIDPAGVRAYVFNYLSNTISIVNIANRTIPATLTTQSNPLRGTFNRKGDQLIIFHEWSPNLIVYDTSSLAVLKTIYVGIGVSFIKLDNATDRLYVAKRHDTIVDIFVPFSAIPIDFLKVAGGATYMQIDDDENNLLLVLPEQSALQSINLVSKKERFIMDTGNVPYWSAIIGER